MAARRYLPGVARARRILLAKAGVAAAAVRAAVGDYDRWFARVLAPLGVELEVVEASLGAPLPDPGAYAGVIVTGSPRSVTERAPWMARLGEAALGAAARGVPVLGVCFGHQLLAWSAGAAVRRSPRGREIGTLGCRLTAVGREDPLFEGVGPAFAVQATHEDEVVEPPPALEVLAGNDACAIQAFRLGPRLRAVQFHPEVDAATMRRMAEARRAGLLAEARARGEDPEVRMREVLAGIRAAPAGERVLRNFAAMCGVKPHSPSSTLRTSVPTAQSRSP